MALERGPLGIIRRVRDDEWYDEAERQLKEQIAYHQQAYQRAVEPIMQRLADLQRLRPQRLMIPLTDAIAAGLIPSPPQP